MEDKQNSFLQREYIRLWKSYGVLDLPERDFAIAGPSQTVEAPAAAPTLSPEEVRRRLGTGCGSALCQTRTNLVFGAGNPQARLMFVGEAPGAEEEQRGEPFVGNAGQLLTKIIEAMGLQRQDVYLANVVKCRPPQNRQPAPAEVAACLPFLRDQIEAVGPLLIVALGATATSALTGQQAPLASLRGKFHTLCWNPQRRVLPTYHPAYLLRNPQAKKTVWEDMKLALSHLEPKP